MNKRHTLKSIIIHAAAFGLGLSAFACGKGAEPDRLAAAKKAKAAAEVLKAEADSDHDKEPPPPPPAGRPVTAYRDGKAEPMTEPQAVAAGLTVIDLSNYWVPFIFSEQDGDGERKPNEMRLIYRKLSNDWHYESRTVAAAREIVEHRMAKAQAAKIFALKQQGVPDEEIRKILGIEVDSESDSESASGSEAGKQADAGDKAKEEGEAEEEQFEGGLGEAEHFLEVFGIPPTLAVLRRRAIEEVGRPCLAEVDFEAIRRYSGFISYHSNERAAEEARRGRPFARKMRAEMERLGVTDPLELIKAPKVKISEGLIKTAIRYEALASAQKLLACEKIYPKGQEKSYWAGGLDWKTQQALMAFEQKNRIFGWGFFGNDTLTALGRTPEERLFDSFMRVLSERVVDATHILEDGTAKGEEGKAPTYKDEAGNTVAVRNLVAEFTAATLRHMGLGTPEKLMAFLKSHDDKSLDSLFIAVPLPAKPPYYADVMDLHAVIDRGDVWYDYPYDTEGRSRNFPRKAMPKLTLFVKWREQDIPLITMNTTIGSWRSELAPDGYEYYKYKNSDVGEKVWRDIVAGPVWLPPDTTPNGDLVKVVTYRGRKVKVPNYDELGPWYASAYGLVAAFHVRPVPRKKGEMDYFDNGIRTHGSVDYNSILRRFSHGCHRLYNHLAIRLFDFVLRHRPFVRVGQVPAGYSHKVVTDEGEEITINLDSKGYKYELKDPVPISVLTGRIRGKQRVPIETYMPKPEEEYGPDAQFLPPGYLHRNDLDGGVAPAAPAAPSGALPLPAATAKPPVAKPVVKPAVVKPAVAKPVAKPTATAKSKPQ